MAQYPLLQYLTKGSAWRSYVKDSVGGVGLSDAKG